MKANRKCAYCHKEYYVCYACIDMNSWKHIACSTTCFKKLIQKEQELKPEIIPQTKDEEMRILFTVKTKKNQNKGIIGYDLELGKFDCEDKTTLEFKDIKTFLIPSEEMKKISEMLSECRKDI